MTVTGPTFVGGNSAQNGNSLAFRPSVLIPAGSSILVPVIVTLPDTTDVAVSDDAGNVYQQRAGSQDPASTHTLFVFECLKSAFAIATSQNISIAMSARSQCVGGAVFLGGLQGFCQSLTTQWDNVASPSINALAPSDGMTLVTIMSVDGPVSDGFTQDARWGTDFLAGTGTGNFSVHGGARIGVASGTYEYKPTLGVVRRTSTMIASLQ